MPMIKVTLDLTAATQRELESFLAMPHVAPAIDVLTLLQTEQRVEVNIQPPAATQVSLLNEYTHSTESKCL